MNDLHADPQHFRVRGKETVQDMAADVQQNTDHDGGRKAHGQTASDALPHAVHLTGAVVLSGKGGDGDTEGADGHPEEGVHLAVYGPGCHGIRSQTVDGGLNDDIGKAVHNGLQTGRKTDADDPAQHFPVDSDAAQLQPVHVFHAHQYQDHQDRA